MKIRLIVVGTRMPGWVTDAYHEYARRLPRECALSLTEIPLGRRARSAAVARAVEEEGRRMTAATLPDERVIALDVGGRSWSTPELAGHLQRWMQHGRDVALLVGGPDGLADSCLRRAEQRWSLSPLTLPHPLVRVLVAEQLYRAWTILSGHPYHRA
ncbi:MAG: 23S rRNA (pseudouridine(1915)-N(3))-methyltransferase RlmH [Gammaproteobacteria bacterium]|jgi:23S rRNA (pseudouridine1915-N3)-methyltransferase